MPSIPATACKYSAESAARCSDDIAASTARIFWRSSDLELAAGLAMRYKFSTSSSGETPA